MANIIRIRNLEQELDFSGVTFPIDKDSYTSVAKRVSGDDLKEWILSGFTGSSGSGSSGTSGTSGNDGLDGIDGTGSVGSSGTSGTSGIGVAGTSGTDGTSGIGTPGTSGTDGIGTPGTSGTSGISPCIIYDLSEPIIITAPVITLWWFTLSTCPGNIPNLYYTGPYTTYLYGSGNRVLGATGEYYVVVNSFTTDPMIGTNIGVSGTGGEYGCP